MRLAFAPVILAVLAGPAVGQPARTHDITPKDYFTLATITEFAISHDGKTVAYTEGRWDKADDTRKTDLWIVATEGKGNIKPRRLTKMSNRKAKMEWDLAWFDKYTKK